MTRTPLLRSFVLTLALLGGFSSAHAGYPFYDWYRGGENDTSPVNGGNVSIAVDSGDNGFNLGATGTPQWSTDVAPAANLLFAPSTFSYTGFTINSYFNSGLPGTTNTDNWGIETWVKFNDTTGTQAIFLNGAGGDGFALFLYSGNLTGLLGGVTLVNSTVSPVAGQWYEFAMVRDSGQTYIYVDGVLTTQGTYGINAASGGMFLGKDNNLSPVNGFVDEARLFYFTGGAFDPVTDLNYVAVPEPATWGLLISGAVLGFVVLRKKIRA